MINNTSRAIAKFAPITLSEMDGVKLMNRTDRKYWFNQSLLAAILEEIAPHYYILEVEGERNMPYFTTYYDTVVDEMYTNHHRGKRNRYKIRRRSYVSSQTSFLEVKFKSNKGRTIKVRKRTNYGATQFDESDMTFIASHTPYTCSDLHVTLNNSFNRLMLVSKRLNERCTIDSQLLFDHAGAECTLAQLVIVEVKSEGHTSSVIVDALRSRRLKPSGFSKYCMGRSLTEPTLIQNNFKRKHRTIEKRINHPINRVAL